MFANKYSGIKQINIKKKKTKEKKEFWSKTI